MKPIYVKSSTYFDFNKDSSNKEYPECELGNHVRISKYKNIFEKDYTPN